MTDDELEFGIMSEIRTGSVTTVNSTRQPIRASAYTEQTTNGQRSLSSTNVNDAAAGTGARTVKITYYDQDMQGPFEETVTLNGTTAVDTVAEDICFIEKMEVDESGPTGLAFGTIRLHTLTAGGGSVFASINAIDSRTRYCHHYIGPNKVFSLLVITASCHTAAFFFDGIIRKYSQPVGATHYSLQPVCSSVKVDPNSPPSAIHFADPVQFLGPGKIELFAQSQALLGGGTIHADFAFYET